MYVAVVLGFPSGGSVDNNVTPLLYYCGTNLKKNSIRWAVWLGRHPDEKISSGPNGLLRWVRTPPLNAKAKAGLM